MHAADPAAVAAGVDHAVPDDAVLDAPRRRVGPLAEVAIVAASWLIGQLVFFRSQWLSGFDRVMGDPGAARFIIYVNENWYQSLLGHASWRNPGFYFPLKGTLGLSDTLLVWQLIYAPARALGADPFLAYQLVLMALSALGFVGFYAFVRTMWRPPMALGVLGAAVFTFSNALYANANHPQLFGVLLLPAVGLLGVAALRDAGRGRRRGAVWGAGLGALAVLCIYSTYYVGFFSVLAVLIALFATVAVAPRRTWHRAVDVVRHGWATILGVVVGAIAPAALFAVTYLPALRSSGGYDLATARYFAPRASDLLNVGLGNLLWGSVVVQPLVHGTAGGPERDYAVTPLLLVASIVVAVIATWRERSSSRSAATTSYSTAVLTFTGLVLLVLPLELGSTFLWSAVAWLPGASGIRAVDRIGVVATGVLALALVDGLARLWPWLRTSVPRVVLVSAVALGATALCLEQVNISDSSMLSRSAQLAVLDSMPAPPRSCSSFFIVSAFGSQLHPARLQTTAMLLSARFGIPTLNGTSGSFPSGWGLLYPASTGYLAGVEHWVALHHLVAAGVCELDLDTKSWSTPLG